MAEPAEPLVLRQPELGEDLDALAPALTDAFLAAREALLADRPVVLVVDDRDLLGQRGVVDACAATGLLGLQRALALEGAKPGWRINVVTTRGEDEQLVARVVGWAGECGLSGQLLRVGSDHLGRVAP